MPNITSNVPNTILLVILSSLFRNMLAKMRVTRGFIANTGDTTTSGALLSAKYISATPDAEKTPDTLNQKNPNLGAVRISVGICLWNMIDTYRSPNINANPVPTRGGAYSVVISLPTV